jgi:hypothetical protein
VGSRAPNADSRQGPKGSPAVSIEDDAVAVEIVTVLSSFVYVHQQLLATVSCPEYTDAGPAERRAPRSSASTASSRCSTSRSRSQLRCALSRAPSMCVAVHLSVGCAVADSALQTYAYALIAFIPTRQQEAMDQHTSLMASLNLAIKTYSS